MENFLGEIRMFGGGYAPSGWALCNGQTMSIAGNEALYTLIGTAYGGDGQQTFGLPNLQSRLPVGQGTGLGLTTRVIGELGGTEQVTVLTGQLPVHNHAAMATAAAGNLPGPTAVAVPATPTAGTGTPIFYAIPGDSSFLPVPMAPQALGAAGASQSHSNMMPSLCVTFIIALTGIFPSRN